MKYIQVSQEFLQLALSDPRVQELKQILTDNSTDTEGFVYQQDRVLIPYDHVQAGWIILIHPAPELIELADMGE